jgi:predicted Fe-Mo cluster-binding NifX family protein
MKIAVITDDEKTISQHFGRAPFYMVFTVDDGKITARERRDKLGHKQFAHEHHEGEHGQPHGYGPDAHDRHIRMSEAIADCEVLLCRGMGAGAYYSMQQRDIRPVVTDIEDIEEAVWQYLAGSLVDHCERLH